MTCQLGDHVKPGAPNAILNDASDLTDAVARACNGQRLAEGGDRTLEKSSQPFGHGGHQDRSCPIRDPAGLLRGHIELDYVSLADLAIARHTVDDFFVDADTDGAGKAVVEPGRRPGAVFGQDRLRVPVESGGGYSRCDVA
jgi:hypothetical protein